MQGKAHDDAVRGEVIAALLEGQGVNQVANALNLPKSTVSRIKNTLAVEQLEQVGTQKRDRLTSLIEGHLTESLKAATSLAVRVQDDTEWFKGQNAADIAVLYGVLTDKAIRILEAAESAGNGEGEASGSVEPAPEEPAAE